MSSSSVSELWSEPIFEGGVLTSREPSGKLDASDALVEALLVRLRLFWADVSIDNNPIGGNSPTKSVSQRMLRFPHRCCRLRIRKSRVKRCNDEACGDWRLRWSVLRLRRVSNVSASYLIDKATEVGRNTSLIP
jgi:hypothetical protein